MTRRIFKNNSEGNYFCSCFQPRCKHALPVPRIRRQLLEVSAVQEEVVPEGNHHPPPPLSCLLAHLYLPSLFLEKKRIEKNFEFSDGKIILHRDFSIEIFIYDRRINFLCVCVM